MPFRPRRGSVASLWPRSRSPRGRYTPSAWAFGLKTKNRPTVQPVPFHTPDFGNYHTVALDLVVKRYASGELDSFILGKLDLLSACRDTQRFPGPKWRRIRHPGFPDNPRPLFRVYDHHSEDTSDPPWAHMWCPGILEIHNLTHRTQSIFRTYGPPGNGE